MNKLITQQMHVISATCYNCDKPINVAIIKINNGACGPEAFTEEQKRIAKNYGVIIREQHSKTRQERYDANTCSHCNTFIGQHYLFSEYFTPAVYYGDYKYEVIDLVNG